MKKILIILFSCSLLLSCTSILGLGGKERRRGYDYVVACDEDGYNCVEVETMPQKMDKKYGKGNWEKGQFLDTQIEREAWIRYYERYKLIQEKIYQDSLKGKNYWNSK